MTEPLSIYQREVWTTFDHHLRWSVFCRILHAIIILKMFPYGWREVKSGEELRELFTPPNALFIGVCEGWVKSEEYLAKFSAATYCRKILPLHTVATPYHSTLSTLFLNAIAKVLNFQGDSNFSPQSRYAFPANGEKRKANGERNGEIWENNIIYTSKTSDIKKYSYFCRI